MMRDGYFIKLIATILILVGCSQSTNLLPTLTNSGITKEVIVVDYPPIEWQVNGEKLNDLGCDNKVQVACPELYALGCDDIEGPRFFLGGLQPPYTVMECIHENGEPPDSEYFKQLVGLDTRYRSFAVYQEGKFKLIIKRTEFKELFAPIESSEEAMSYAMAMTSLEARFDINPKDEIEYLVDVIEETHVEEISDGYLVYLFDWSHEMGCDIHPFYAVKVLVTREGDVQEVERQVIYKQYSCFDFEVLTLDDD